jgi:hypothetical protein
MFKKMLIAGLVLSAVAVMPAMALDNITPPAGGGFYDGKANQPQSDGALTNTTTTQYTPRYIGDWLLGKIDTSNAVWIARGLTTADWSLVDGNGGDFTADDLAADSVGASELIEAEIYTVAGMTNTGSSVISGDLVIAEGKLNDSTVVSADIKDGVIANADIATGAAIAPTKINFGGVYVTNVLITADAKTNTVILEGITIKSWIVAQ